MATTVLDEQIGSVSVLSTIEIEKKGVTVVYEVDYNGTSYFIDVIVIFREIVGNGKRYLFSLQVEDALMDFSEFSPIPADDMVKDSLYVGLSKRFPGFAGMEEVSTELANSLIQRIESFSIAVNERII